MKRALPSVLLLVLPGCREDFDIDKYLIAETGSGESGDATETTMSETGSGTAESETDSESSSSESASETATDTTETDSESSDTDVTCEPGELDIGAACITTEQEIETFSNAPTDLEVHDFTGDGRFDLLIAGTQVTVRPGNLSGQFGAPINITGATGTGLAAHELDGNNDIDFATFSNNQIQIFNQMGGGAFTLGPSIMAMAGGYDGVFGDIDDDQDDDLVVSGGSLRTFTVFGAVNWTPGPEYLHAGQGLVLVPLDDDGLNDVALAMTASSVVGLFVGDGMGMFADPNQTFVTSVADVATADINNDTRLDLVAINTDEDRLVVILVENGTLVEFQQRPVGDAPRGVAVGDFNDDGLDDVAVANSGSHDVSILLGTGTGLSDSMSTLDPDAGDQPEAITTRDLDNDQRDEIVVGMLGSNRVLVYGDD